MTHRHPLRLPLTCETWLVYSFISVLMVALIGEAFGLSQIRRVFSIILILYLLFCVFITMAMLSEPSPSVSFRAGYRITYLIVTIAVLSACTIFMLKRVHRSNFVRKRWMAHCAFVTVVTLVLVNQVRMIENQDT